MTVRPHTQFPWKTIREKVLYDGRTRRSDRAGKTRRYTALLEMRTALLETAAAKHPDSRSQISRYGWMQPTHMRNVTFLGKFTSSSRISGSRSDLLKLPNYTDSRKNRKLHASEA